MQGALKMFDSEQNKYRGERCSNFWWISRRLTPHWPLLAASVGCIFANAVTALIEPLVLMWVIDKVLPARDSNRLGIAALILLAASGGGYLLGRMGGRLLFHLARRFRLKLRMDIFYHLGELSADYHDTKPIGRSLFVMNECVDQIGELVEIWIPSAVKTTILLGGATIAMLHLNRHLAIASLPLIPLFLIVTHRFGQNLEGAAFQMQHESGEATAFLQDHLSAIVEVSLLNGLKLQARKAYRAWARQTRAASGCNAAEIKYALGSNLIIVSALVIGVYYGGIQVLYGSLTIGAFVAFYAYLRRVFDPLYAAADMGSSYRKTSASIGIVRKVFNETPSVAEHKNAIELPMSERVGEIRIEGISFSYPKGRSIFKNVSLTIHAGERVALIGPSGSGKSTVAKLISRLYEISSGRIFIDGADIQTLKLWSLRHEVCYIPQRASLIGGTLRDNLRLASPWASDQELQDVTKAASLISVIERFPRGWDEPIGDRGNRLSGGERQRVAIARALLLHPRIMILDEATAELDGETEKLIFSHIDRCLANTTLILITHRISSVSWVDRTILLTEENAFASVSPSDGRELEPDGAKIPIFQAKSDLRDDSQSSASIGFKC